MLERATSPATHSDGFDRLSPPPPPPGAHPGAERAERGRRAPRPFEAAPPGAATGTSAGGGRDSQANKPAGDKTAVLIQID
mmetsp:Transcript_52519/g.119701  ORF Transcript_52519/g.119701 Transcript_52519/m.119701 type:complete len:81 (-) Transcript_52519:11-253(-)